MPLSEAQRKPCLGKALKRKRIPPPCWERQGQQPELHDPETGENQPSPLPAPTNCDEQKEDLEHNKVSFLFIQTKYN